MAARKTRRTVKRRSPSIKAKLSSVIKSLQYIEKHVDGKPAPKRVKRATKKRGPAKTIRMPSLYEHDFDEEPVTLDSPTVRRPRATLLPRMTLRSPTF